MKKSIIFIVCLLSTVASMAQFRAGIKAGVNISNISMSINGMVPEIYNPRMGFHVGLMNEWMFIKRFGLQAELMYVNSGVTINPKKYTQGMELPENLSLTGFVNMHTLQLPLYVKTKIKISPTIRIYVMGGGFASYAPTASQNITFSDGKETIKVKWSLYEPQIRVLDQQESNVYMQQRWNAGIATEAGVDFMNQFTAGVSFRHVLNNMAVFGYLVNGQSIRPSIKMWTATLSLGYYF